MAVRIGSRTIQLNHAPSIVGFAAVQRRKRKVRWQITSIICRRIPPSAKKPGKRRKR